MKTIYEDNYKLLIIWLKEERKKKGIKQEELAQKIGVNNKWLSRVENIERRIDVMEIWLICAGLEVDFVEVMKRFDSIMKRK